MMNLCRLKVTKHKNKSTLDGTLKGFHTKVCLMKSQSLVNKQVATSLKGFFFLF